jgi:hypothetical protein
MRQATKELVKFTNKWKSFPEKRNKMYRSSVALSIPDLRVRAGKLKTTKLSKPLIKIKGVHRYMPSLPLPKQEKTSARISFVAKKKDIEKVSQKIFDDPNVKPSDVGEAVFAKFVASIK